MHGSAKTMTASETLTIDLNNLTEIFDFLPTIMHPNGALFLDSCLTGSLQNGCNNMQFAFAKLTLKKPNIEIAAPSDYLHVSYFSISEEGNFSFEMLNANNRQNNISLILGQKTKAILSKAMTSNIPLESIQNELIASLDRSKIFPFLRKYGETYETFDLTEQLIKTINGMQMKSSSATLKQVKDLIETYHASPNYPEGLLLKFFLLKNVSPLACAIYYKLTNVALYLIQHGADPFYTFEGKILLDHAKERDEDNKKYSLEESFDGWAITQRREKENDHSKIFDAIENYLSLQQQSTTFQSPLNSGFSDQKNVEVTSNNSTPTNQLSLLDNTFSNL